MIKLPKFSARVSALPVRFLQRALVICFACRPRNRGLLGSSTDTMLLSHEKCLRVLALLYLLDFSLNSSNHSGRSRKRFPAACLLSSFLLCFFWEYRVGFLALVGKHRLLDSKNLINPAVTM